MQSDVVLVTPSVDRFLGRQEELWTGGHLGRVLLTLVATVWEGHRTSKKEAMACPGKHCFHV